ncbi:MAG TPA: hypothetical protein VKV21_15995 [Solirubrobacteraceae bacterium]|nr:hypothetical protein [Solirubrobacteraceae bacterium]
MFRTRSTGPVGPLTLFIRYGIGLIGVVAGVVVLAVNPGGFGVDGFGLLTGAGLSILMLNWMFRVGVSGDLEREREERARRYFEEHGHWPGEPPRPRRRPPNAGPRGSGPPSDAGP